MYKLIGARSTAGREHVYVANVGIDVLSEVMRTFREVLMKRHGEYWREHFDDVSRLEYFPRGPSVFVVSVAEREFLPMVKIFCFSKKLPEVAPLPPHPGDPDHRSPTVGTGPPFLGPHPLRRPAGLGPLSFIVASRQGLHVKTIAVDTRSYFCLTA